MPQKCIPQKANTDNEKIVVLEHSHSLDSLSLSGSPRKKYDRRFPDCSRWPELLRVIFWCTPSHFWHHLHGFWYSRQSHLNSASEISLHMQLGWHTRDYQRFWPILYHYLVCPPVVSVYLVVVAVTYKQLFTVTGKIWVPSENYFQRGSTVPMSECYPYPTLQRFFYTKRQRKQVVVNYMNYYYNLNYNNWN